MVTAPQLVVVQRPTRGSTQSGVGARGSRRALSRAALFTLGVLSVTACGGATPAPASEVELGQASAVDKKGQSAFKVQRPGVCARVQAEQCFNALDDNCNGAIDEGCGVDSGLVQFVIAWQPADADVDLEVRDPRGELVELNQAKDSGLIRDRDCPGAQNECRGRSVENVYLTDEDKLQRGTYQVTVRLERWSDIETPVRVNFSGRLGASSFGKQLTFAREKQEYRSAWVL